LLLVHVIIIVTKTLMCLIAVDVAMCDAATCDVANETYVSFHM